MVATATDNSASRYQGYGWRSFLIFSSWMSPRSLSVLLLATLPRCVSHSVNSRHVVSATQLDHRKLFVHLPICAFHLFAKAKNRSVRFSETICGQSLDRGAAGRSAVQPRPHSSAGNAGSSRKVQRFLFSRSSAAC